MGSETVWHEGEKELHRAFGRSDRLDEIGAKVLRDHMPDQHRDFFASLQTVHIGVLDVDGHPWAIMRIGPSGFMSSPDPKTLILQSKPLPGEPEGLRFGVGEKISIVGIEYPTRRRNRLNAVIKENRENELVLTVDQSFGNCPKYIQTRELTIGEDNKSNSPIVHSGSQLSPNDAQLVHETNTLFIASRSGSIGAERHKGVDINHRGGNPGFINILDDQTFEFLDYVGNNFFNTLGNFSQDSRAGLQLVHHELGTLLSIKGTAELLVSDAVDLKPPHTNRKLRIHIEDVVRVEHAIPVLSEFGEYSPMLPGREKP